MLTALARVFRSGRMFAEAMYQRRVPYFSLDRLLWMQRENVRRIVRHAYETTPFYRQFMLRQGLRPEDFRTVADLATTPRGKFRSVVPPAEASDERRLRGGRH